MPLSCCDTNRCPMHGQLVNVSRTVATISQFVYVTLVWWENLTSTVCTFAHLTCIVIYCSHFTLENAKKSFFNSIVHTYFSLCTLSQKKTNCYSLTHHTWKMSLHYLVKCTNFSSFSFFSHISSANPRYGRVAEASCCDITEFQQSVVDEAVDQWGNSLFSSEIM